MTAKKLVLVGGGAFSRELINWIYDLQDNGIQLEILGFLDSSREALAGFSYNLQYLGEVDSYKPAPDEYLLMGIGDPIAKERLFHKFKEVGANFFTLIHPKAVVARTALIGEGVVVCPSAFVSADAVVGDLVAINGCASVGHDAKVGAFSTLSSHVDLTGWVNVGERVFMGSGARVIPKKRVGDGATVGAGAVVMMHVPENAVVYASPARRL